MPYDASINTETNEPTTTRWPFYHLCGTDRGVFSLGVQRVDFKKGSGDMGGNLEVSSPNSLFPLGRIICGNNADSKLQEFLTAQECQKPVFAYTEFMEVGHVDEVIAFGETPGRLYRIDPAAGQALLQAAFTSEDDQLAGVLFSTDQERAAVAQVAATTQLTTPDSGRFLTTNLNYDTYQSEWQKYVNGYVRIAKGEGQGMVGKIIASRRGLGGTRQDKLELEIHQTWDTNVMGVSGRKDSANQPQVKWNPRVPTAGDCIVVVKGSKLWESGCPALITVYELLRDPEFQIASESQGLDLMIDDIANLSAVPAVGLPALLYYRTTGLGNKAYALCPNPVNLQISSGLVYCPKPFGPRNIANEDVLEKELKRLIPSAIFVDDWDHYHCWSGNVHCGSAAKREGLDEWWNKQP